MVADAAWTNYTDWPCTRNDIHLYCVSDAIGPVFSDGFELGGTSAWSATVP